MRMWGFILLSYVEPNLCLIWIITPPDIKVLSFLAHCESNVRDLKLLFQIRVSGCLVLREKHYTATSFNYV